ncbi:ABC transporter ATP-binding protein [Longispora albida]|uniref:ABC transporter ATP-binding protein n=1 Tax=Longispora albida TaxID=203523 RepID=UPI0003820DBC|nr:ABC transporter ATP-binding protein [Longispora albida]
MTKTIAAQAVAGAALSLSGLHKRYGEIRAVDGVDLTIAPGEVVALLGPNGAGKSTTVDIMLGLSRPDSGEVAIFGKAPREAVLSGSVGAMLQKDNLRADVTVGETLAIVAALHGRPERAAETMRQAGIDGIAGQKCGKLSGGQKQRVRFAIALVSEPDFLVLDEPTVAMDVEIRRQFWQSMREYTSRGRTVLFATHYLAEAEEFADRVVMLRAGRVIADGTVAQVRSAVSGRTLRAVVPGASADQLAGLPSVTGLELRDGRAVLSCADSDRTLRALLAAFPAAHDIEIAAVNLEDAFLALTSEENL